MPRPSFRLRHSTKPTFSRVWPRAVFSTLPCSRAEGLGSCAPLPAPRLLPSGSGTTARKDKTSGKRAASENSILGEMNNTRPDEGREENNRSLYPCTKRKLTPLPVRPRHLPPREFRGAIQANTTCRLKSCFAAHGPIRHHIGQVFRRHCQEGIVWRDMGHRHKPAYKRVLGTFRIAKTRSFGLMLPTFTIFFQIQNEGQDDEDVLLRWIEETSANDEATEYLM
jgi:hypothetical protein